MSKDPVIGILTHPGDGSSQNRNTSHIPAPYVRFVECGGARVIPLIYDEPDTKLFQKLDLVNGVLFTSGWDTSTTEGYYKAVDKIFKKALEKNDDGDHFPVYAINSGFQHLIRIIRKDKRNHETCRNPSRATSLQFSKNALFGTVFGRFPADLLDKLATDCLVNVTNNFGISPEEFESDEKLKSFFQILTTCTDKDNKVFVSTAQSQKYPVTIFQWNPQKNAFEWGSSGVPHNEDAIRVTQHAANFLVSEARKSRRSPDAQKVAKKVPDNLIYKIAPRDMRKDSDKYGEVYVFPKC